MVLMNIFAGQQQRCRHKEQTCGHSMGGRWWDEQREYGNIYTTLCQIDSQREFVVGHRELSLVPVTT